MSKPRYKIRVVRGAFTDPSILDQLGAKVIEKAEDPNWQSIDEVIIELDQIHLLQEGMTRHFNDTSAPWYVDGYNVKDKDDYVVAFGADDGEGGKLFHFSIRDKKVVNEIIEYGISKGIPKEQLDWMDIKF